MTSTPDDRTPAPSEGPDAPLVPEPPTAAEGTPSAPAPDWAAWGTTSSPVYAPTDAPAAPDGAETQPLPGGSGDPGGEDTQRLPTLDDTQPLTAGLNDTQPLAWTPPAPPTGVDPVPAPTARVVPVVPAPDPALAPSPSPVPSLAAPSPEPVPAPTPAPAPEPAPAPAPPPAPAPEPAPAPASPPAPAPASTVAAAPYGAQPPSPPQPPAAPPAPSPAPPLPQGAPPSPYGAPSAPYGAPSAPYGAPQAPYGAPPAQFGAPPHGAPPHGAPPPPPPGAPPYGAPRYGAPGHGAHYAAPNGPTDGLAVASLVTSAVGLFLAGAPGPVGVGLGIGALRRIRRTGAGGRGLAITGIVLGALGTLLLAFVIWATVAFVQWGASTARELEGALGGAQDLEGLLGGQGGGDPSGELGDLGGLLGQLEQQLEDLETTEGQALDSLPAYTLPQDVAVGTCWESHPELYDLSDAVGVPCTQTHASEVVAVLTASGAPAVDLTVEDPVLAAAQEQCEAAVSAIDPGLLVWGSAEVWLPHPDQVAAGQLVGYCVHESILGSDESLIAPAGMSS